MVKLTNLRIPFTVGVVVEKTPRRALNSVRAAFAEGADAVELNLPPLERIPPEVFVHGPVYTSCRRAPFMAVYGDAFVDVKSRGDEVRMSFQLEALELGSAGLDIEADTFDPTPDEWTRSRAAIRRQASLAAQVGAAGRAAIFSWHPPRKVRFSEALDRARKLRERGADFVKIVERVSSHVEAADTIAISLRLREKLDFPFVFLALGAHALPFRPFMTRFGNAYALARPARGGNQLPAQPTITVTNQVRSIPLIA